MALVRLRRGGQVTVPAAMRRQLRVEAGDYFETELVEGGVLLKPVSATDRERARKALGEILAQRKWIGPEPNEDEVMAMAVDLVHEVRRDRAKSRS